MRGRSVTLAGTLAGVLAVTAASAPASAAGGSPAKQPAPSAHAAGLLNGLGLGGVLGTTLGSSLGGLLGGSGQQLPLQNLLGLLQGGQAPTGALLTPLQTLLGQVAGTPGLPPESRALINQVSALLGSAGSGDPLAGAQLAPVAGLLRNLAATPDVPGSAAQLLNDLADVLDDDAGGGLPMLLNLAPTLVDQLDGILRQLENGGRPTGTLLRPVADLFRQVGADPALPTELATLIDQVGGTLENTVGALDPLLTTQVTLLLREIAGTPGVSTSTRTTLDRISTLIQQGAAAGGGSGSGSGAAGGNRAAARSATARDRAAIKSIRLNRARTRIVVKLACPSSAPAPCATLTRASFAGRKAAQGKRVRIGAGRTKVVRLRMVRAARASSVSNGGRLSVRVTTTFGSKRFAIAKGKQLRAAPRV